MQRRKEMEIGCDGLLQHCPGDTPDSQATGKSSKNRVLDQGVQFDDLLNCIFMKIIQMKVRNMVYDGKNHEYCVGCIYIKLGLKPLEHDCRLLKEKFDLKRASSHVSMVADAMTRRGFIMPITAVLYDARDSSVLGRASFQNPLEMLVHAAVMGEVR